MPYTMQNLPDVTKKLPEKAKGIWVKAFNAAIDSKQGEGDNEQYAFAVAWAAVKEKYEQDEQGLWRVRKMDDVLIEQTTKISKVDEEKRIVWGIVYEPDVVDTQGDFAKTDEIEKACHQFLEDYNQIGKMHENALSRQQAATVESYIAPVDFVLGDGMVKQGTWVMAVHVQDEEIWQQITSGEIAAFSMGGTGKRRPA